MLQQQQQQQQQRGQMPINSRKHARTSTLSLSTKGVDVHSQSGGVQQLTSSNSKDMFSNLQFAPFSNNNNHQQQQQSFQSSQQNHIASNNNQQQQQHHQGFLSSSLPVTTNFDSIMMANSNNISEISTNQFNNHPNLNKLLLNNNNNNNSHQNVSTNLAVFGSSLNSKLPVVGKLLAANSKKATPGKKLTGSLLLQQQQMQKKRPMKKQELFDEDSEESEEEDDEELSEDELTETMSSRDGKSLFMHGLVSL